MTTLWMGCNLLPMVENLKYKGFSERLFSLMRGKNIGVTELSQKAGVTYEMARRYTLGAAKPRPAILEKLAKALDTTASYLEYGAAAQAPEQPSGSQVRLTQLEVFASAGTGYINNEFPAIVSSIEFPESKVYELFGRKSLEGVQLINVDGDSMMPTLCPKDLLFIDTKIDHFNGDGVYVFNFEDSTFVKRLQKVKGRKLAVLSDNDKYPPFYIESHEMNDLYIFGKLIKHLPLKFNDFA
ncbi:XRE family transcriptional regulator [Serratia liquefaciens]|uniref:XRE family transcriptional regulator n=2 Tax=Serratia liquefaciens TaxID=614 RepID=UPI00236172D1|nr:helix-turn-helix transcriptional regulator [Serratia liquefaciens]